MALLVVEPAGENASSCESNGKKTAALYVYYFGNRGCFSFRAFSI
jgi:hypothetical protein